MRRLVLVCALVGATSLAIGCTGGGTGDDDGDIGFINARWNFGLVAGSTIPCPPGNDVLVQARGTENIDDIFTCGDLQGTSADGHIIGDYDVQIIVGEIDGQGNVLNEYAESPTFAIDLVPSDVTVSETFIDDGG